MYYKFQYKNNIYTYTEINSNKNLILNIGSSILYSNLFQDINNKNIVHLDLVLFTEEILPFNNNLSMDLLIESIEYFRQQFKINEFIIMAHSYWGYIAIEYAKKYPQFIKNIILIGTCPLNTNDNFIITNKFFQSIDDIKRKKQLEMNLNKIKNSKNNFINKMETLVPMLWYKYEKSYNIYNNITINEKLLNEFFVYIESNYQFNLNGLENIKIDFINGIYDFLSPFFLLYNLLNTYNINIHIMEKSGHYPFYEESKKFSQLLKDIIS